MGDLDFLPSNWATSDTAIKVIGIGGGGCNAVNSMYRQGIKGCSFYVCNTDSQALYSSPVPSKIQLGKGLGAGCDPIKGRNAALDSQAALEAILSEDTQMLFLTAGMGGGTGTGATPVVAKMAKDKGILTIAVVTIPFSDEGSQAITRAINGISELEKNVDSLLIINNDKLYDVFGQMKVQDAFPKADEVLATAVRSITDFIKKEGYINVDFQDIKTMMKNSGMALMGTGTGTGPNRIEDAVKQALESPLLNDFDLKTASNILTNVTIGRNEQGVDMHDYKKINDLIDEYTGHANKFKSGLILDDDPSVGDKIKITAIATGFKFIKLAGACTKSSNIIIIPRDFVYDHSQHSDKEGISLPESTSVITYSSGPQVKMNIDLSTVPCLLVGEGADIADLENTPAIRRKHTQAI